MQAPDHIRDILEDFYCFCFGTVTGSNRCPGRSVSVKGTVFRTGTFYIVAAFTSFTFNLLIYTLTVSFGDVGKAFVVVVMVIQDRRIQRNISD